MDKLLEDITLEEVNLEELIVLGEDKKIPIVISYPTEDGKQIKAKALIKQLTLKEMDKLQTSREDLSSFNMRILEEALFKSNGDTFTEKELEHLPLGVVNSIGEKILELSGVNIDTKRLQDF